MKKLLTVLALMISMPALASNSCNLCISYNVEENFINTEIDPIDECESMMMESDRTCEKIISLLGSESFPGKTFINNIEVKNRYVYTAMTSEYGNFEQLFLNIQSKYDVELNIKSDRISSQFLVLFN